MRVWFAYISFLLVGFCTFLLLLSFSVNPERAIVGEWSEVAWAYDSDNEANKEAGKMVGSQGFFFHEEESWDFHPDGTFLIRGRDNSQKGSWSIKGRGHILQMKYDNNLIESYNIDILNGNEMVLNFEDDLEVRGISKLTFNRKEI